MKPLALAILLLLSALPAAEAALVYALVDYPDLQNGYRLSGTITVSDSAADDGLLTVNEVLDWEWTAFSRLTFAGEFRPVTLVEHEPVTSRGIEIDEEGIYLPTTGEAFLQLEDYSVEGRLYPSSRLDWTLFGDGRSEYALSGRITGNLFFAPWVGPIPINSTTDSRWTIARSVPESASLVNVVAIVFGLWRRGRWIRFR